MPRVTISRRGEDRARAGHPWIYRSDVETVDGAAGDLVQVVGSRGRPVGHALFSDESEITLRMIAYGSGSAPETFVKDRLAAAIAFRESLALEATAYRLVHGEADRLPSLIVDRYGDYLVIQTLSQGIDRRVPEIVSALVELAQPKGILARNDPRVRLLEGLEQRVEVVFGDVPERIEVRERARSSTRWIRGGGRRPGCFSISARTVRRRWATRAGGCSMRSVTTAASRSRSRGAASRFSPSISLRTR